MHSGFVAVLGGTNDGHIDPSTLTHDQLLALIHGSIWTARSQISQGPRPHDPSNINALDYYETYGAVERKQMLADYKSRGYTAAPFGPFAGGDCYHGKYACDTSIPTQARWNELLDIAQEWWDAGIAPVYFAKPDNAENDPATLDALDALHRQSRAQKLLRIVIYPGWEPSGSKYGWKNEVYVRMLKRGAAVFPNALLGLHTVSDLDAPLGGDDDPVAHMPDNKAVAWKNCTPFMHFWAVQIDGYINSGPQLTEPFLTEFKKLWPDYNRRFQNEWRGTTAWVDNRPIAVGYAEGASYPNFWSNWPEDISRQLGDIALSVGAAFAFDGCH